MLSWIFSVIIIEPFYDDFHSENKLQNFLESFVNRFAWSTKRFENCGILYLRIATYEIVLWNFTISICIFETFCKINYDTGKVSLK